MVRYYSLLQRSLLRSSAVTLLSLVTFTWFSHAHADIETLCAGISPCSATGEITTGVSGTLNVTWQGTVEANGSNFPSELVSSNGGTFYVAQGQQFVPVGSVFTALSQTVLFNPSGGGAPFTFTETVTVPANVSMAAANLGATQIIYLRQFTAPASSLNGLVTFPLRPMPPQLGGGVTPPPPAPIPGVTTDVTAVELLRVVLRFDDDSISKVIARDEALRASLEMNYNNGGLFVGVWEIATPMSTQGEPVFIPLENVRLYLDPSRKKVLTSPALPTDQVGLYYLRFRSVQPQTAQDTLQIQYFVTERGPAQQKAVQSMRTYAPAADTWLKPQTRFQWQPVAKARAYRLEIFASHTLPDAYREQSLNAAASSGSEKTTNPVQQQQSIQAITGVLVPATQTEIAMPGVSFSHLRASQHYVWRVIAIDAAGDVIGETALQDIHTQ